MTNSFVELHLLPQLPTTLGQTTSANSLSVVLASDYTLSVTATNPSVSNTGSAVPTQATMVGGNQSGNLVALTLTGTGALKVDGSAVTQPVSGTVAVSNATLAVTQSGTWTVQPGNTANTTPWLTSISASGNTATVSAGGALKVDGSAVTQPVSGTFWQATQPVSAASLPLPTGAATSAKQPALGTAGSASTDVVTVQGIASMTALKVDGSGVTQPVSGTITANQGSPNTAANAWFHKNTDGTNTAAVKAASTAAAASDPSLVVALSPNSAPAASTGRSSVLVYSNNNSTGNISTSAYTQIAASTSGTINRLCVDDTSGQGFYIATGAAGLETNVLVVPPGGNDVPFEIQIASGTRLSVKALTANMTSGYLFITGLS